MPLIISLACRVCGARSLRVWEERGLLSRTAAGNRAYVLQYVLRQGAKTADWWMVNDVNEGDFRTATAHVHSRPQSARGIRTRLLGYLFEIKVITHVDIQKDFV